MSTKRIQHYPPPQNHPWDFCSLVHLWFAYHRIHLSFVYGLPKLLVRISFRLYCSKIALLINDDHVQYHYMDAARSFWLGCFFFLEVLTIWLWKYGSMLCSASGHHSSNWAIQWLLDKILPWVFGYSLSVSCQHTVVKCDLYIIIFINCISCCLLHNCFQKLYQLMAKIY